MYNVDDDSIAILYKNDEISDISEASELLNVQLLSKKKRKTMIDPMTGRERFLEENVLPSTRLLKSKKVSLVPFPSCQIPNIPISVGSMST